MGVTIVDTVSGTVYARFMGRSVSRAAGRRAKWVYDVITFLVFALASMVVSQLPESWLPW